LILATAFIAQLDHTNKTYPATFLFYSNVSQDVSVVKVVLNQFIIQPADIGT
jgi:hypothetical protein